ncbi:hypothetical protein HMPREF9946_02560 [Acetobacteraceae bacterium AT-5844]|nr:hypothetical protein HMPREF9946_02560 [Acetobacteraceae bacterium AT-5844]
MLKFLSQEDFRSRYPDAPPPGAVFVELGTRWNQPETDHGEDGAPVVPPVRLDGYFVMAIGDALPEELEGLVVPSLPSDPVVPGEPPPAVPPDPGTVPLEITRAQARVAMAAYILPDGRSLLTATRELLQAQLDATAALPDADPQRIAALQASEWWTAAATYRRDHPVLLQIADLLGVSAAETNALFREAAQIVT